MIITILWTWLQLSQALVVQVNSKVPFYFSKTNPRFLEKFVFDTHFVFFTQNLTFRGDDSQLYLSVSQGQPFKCNDSRLFPANEQVVNFTGREGFWYFDLLDCGSGKGQFNYTLSITQQGSHISGELQHTFYNTIFIMVSIVLSVVSVRKTSTERGQGPESKFVWILWTAGIISNTVALLLQFLYFYKLQVEGRSNAFLGVLYIIFKSFAKVVVMVLLLFGTAAFNLVPKQKTDLRELLGVLCMVWGLWVLMGVMVQVSVGERGVCCRSESLGGVLTQITELILLIINFVLFLYFKQSVPFKNKNRHRRCLLLAAALLAQGLLVSLAQRWTASESRWGVQWVCGECVLSLCEGGLVCESVRVSNFKKETLNSINIKSQ